MSGTTANASSLEVTAPGEAAAAAAAAALAEEDAESELKHGLVNGWDDGDDSVETDAIMLLPESEESRSGDESGSMEAAFSHEPTFDSNIEEIGGVDIKVLNANKIYGTGPNAFHAVRNANLSLKPGSITALLGPSGSGTVSN